MNLIETDQLRKVYQSPRGKNRKVQTVEAVKGIDLQVGEGEIFGFLGPNGAGKTTSLRMLSTLINPTSGQACIAGYDPRQHSLQLAMNRQAFEEFRIRLLLAIIVCARKPGSIGFK